MTEMEGSINSINRNYQDLSNRYNRLIVDNRQIGSGSAADKQYWEEELAKKTIGTRKQTKRSPNFALYRSTKGKKSRRIIGFVACKRRKWRVIYGYF